MKRALGILLLLFLACHPVSAQTAVIKAVDTATGATTDVGNATDHAVRVTQGSSTPWTINWTLLLGAAPSATNPMPSRLTDGTSFFDPRTIRALTSGDVVTIVPPALTKGTQGATGASTQDLKDAGRTAISFYAQGGNAGTSGTDTIITLTQAKGTGATTSSSSYTITSGKTLRITAISVATRGSATATVQSTIFTLRLNTAGACTVTSTPILIQLQSATPATASAWDRVVIPVPDGYEIAGNGTISICMTNLATYVTNTPTIAVNLLGFEY